MALCKYFALCDWKKINLFLFVFFIQRREREGFRKNRPESANPGRPGADSPEYLFPSEVYQDQKAQSRPSTAGGGRLTQSINNLKQFASLQQAQNSTVRFDAPPLHSRPQTAGPAKSRSALNIENAQQHQEMEFTGGLSKPQAVNYSQAFTPLFVEKDRQVCRFYAHFFQARVWGEGRTAGGPRDRDESVPPVDYFLLPHRRHGRDLRAACAQHRHARWHIFPQRQDHQLQDPPAHHAERPGFWKHGVCARSGDFHHRCGRIHQRLLQVCFISRLIYFYLCSHLDGFVCGVSDAS